MPEHIRALIVILALSSVVFLLAKAPATAMAMAPADFVRRRNLWFAVTLAAFLAHSFWVFVIAAAFLLAIGAAREHNKLALFFFLLFAVPNFQEEISGIGGIRYFFSINYLRLLALAILLPACWYLRQQPGVERFGKTLPDKLLIGYLGLNALLMLTASTMTNTLRHGVFYAVIDVFLPYYVASRFPRSVEGFREALMAFGLAALALSTIAFFEMVRHWLLYTSLENALGTWWGYGNYLDRDELLRAQGSTGQPIALGYVTAVALCIFVYLRKVTPNKMYWALGVIVLGLGLVSSLSRGPWIGAALMGLAFIMTSASPGPRLAFVALISVATIPALTALPLGDRIIELLPFIGTVEAENVSYRRRLLEVSTSIILQSPFFGAYDYMYSPAMQELRQGQGIIDIVNSYLGVALNSGLVGLSLYVSFFFSAAWGALRAMKQVPRDSERHVLGQALFASLLGILIIIFTVSSITVIPVIYWSFAGLCVAYARGLAPTALQATTPRSNRTQAQEVAMRGVP
jgi:hypothetical protein